jgi:hypothetical protein
MFIQHIINEYNYLTELLFIDNNAQALKSFWMIFNHILYSSFFSQCGVS